MSTYLFQNTYIYDGQMERGLRCDVLVENGVISKIEAPNTIDDGHVSFIDCNGENYFFRFC